MSVAWWGDYTGQTENEEASASESSLDNEDAPEEGAAQMPAEPASGRPQMSERREQHHVMGECQRKLAAASC